MGIDADRVQALCFDVDGTLSDTDDLYVLRFEPFFRLLPGTDSYAAARRFVMWAEAPGNALMGLPDTLGLDDELLGLWEWLNRRRPRPMKHFMLVPGVDRLLKKLHKKYPMAVVSARDEKSTLAFLDSFALTDCFEVIVTALTAEHTKPYPDPVLYAARAMGVKPRNCLMIGDTTVDIRSGRAAGAQTVGVLCGFGELEELWRSGADELLETTTDLGRILK